MIVSTCRPSLKNRILGIERTLKRIAVAGLASTSTFTIFTLPLYFPASSTGHELKISQYRGKVVLLAFGFTSCTEVCPTTLNTFAVARRKLGPQAADVQVVYVTVDPG